MKEEKGRRERFCLMQEYTKLPAKTDNFMKKLHMSFNKIRKCVGECHSGDLESFLSMSGALAYANYKCLCSKRHNSDLE